MEYIDEGNQGRSRGRHWVGKRQLTNVYNQVLSNKWRNYYVSSYTCPQSHIPWNKGELIGQKPPFKLKEIWGLRIRLQLAIRIRDLALFNLAIDSKLRGCDLVKLRVLDVTHGNHVAKRAMVMQQKTKQPVQFEITGKTRDADSNWINQAHLSGNSQLFPSRLKSSPLTSHIYLSTHQEPKRGSIAAWAHHTGKHCSVSRYRSR